MKRRIIIATFFSVITFSFQCYSQNIGINDDGTNPTESLHVKSTAAAEHGILIESTVNNPRLQWRQGGTTQFTLGVDNADLDKLKLGTTSIGTNTRITIDASGNVGIGTTSPSAKLEVAGQVKITGGSPGVGKVLTSDASGTGTWATPAPASGSATLEYGTVGVFSCTSCGGWATADVSSVVGVRKALLYLRIRPDNFVSGAGLDLRRNGTTQINISGAQKAPGTGSLGGSNNVFLFVTTDATGKFQYRTDATQNLTFFIEAYW